MATAYFRLGAAFRRYESTGRFEPKELGKKHLPLLPGCDNLCFNSRPPYG